MGYGGSQEDAQRAIGRSGDEGIDGIIKEDPLGFDAIYLQAKRWENAVGRPEVQKFAGALQAQKARKGVLITTSAFTRENRIRSRYRDQGDPDRRCPARRADDRLRRRRDNL